MYYFPRIELHAVDHCTLSCVGCNHASPFLQKKMYCAEDYFPWLDLIRSKNCNWRLLAISGGEPFLLKEKLNDFCYNLKQKYKDTFIEVFTNAFWLDSMEVIEKYNIAFRSIDRLVVSYYEPYIKKFGFQNMKDRISEIGKRYSIQTSSFQENGTTYFGQVLFFDDLKVVPNRNCPVKDCTQLTKNGLLYRCTYGHMLNTVIASDSFKKSKDIIFDLKTEIDSRDLVAWREKWPLDNCSFCGCGNNASAKWQSDPKIKTMNKEQYEKKVNNLINGIPDQTKLFL